MLDCEVKYTSVTWHRPAVLGIGRNISRTRNDFEKKFAALQTRQKGRKSQEISAEKRQEWTSYEENVMYEVSNDTFGGSSVSTKN